MAPTEHDTHLTEWQKIHAQHRPFLVSFAFRMTGSLAEAEDLVQDTFLACAAVDPASIDNHKSWLTKVCSNKGLDFLKSAKQRREVYPGVWIPDAIPDSLALWPVEAESADRLTILRDSLSISFLLLLERLGPEERVVYLLSEIFEYPFSEIALFLGKSTEACRKIAQRAREAVAVGRPRFDARSVGAVEVVASFFEAARSGDRARVMALLADDSEMWSDGGGKVAAAPRVLRGEQIAIFWEMVVRLPAMNSGDVRMEYAEVSSRPGYLISRRGADGGWRFETVISFEFVGGRIARLFAMRNPERLGGVLR